MLIPTPRIRFGRYRIRSSTKLIHKATRDHWPPAFNFVEVEPHPIVHESVGTGPAFAEFIIHGFDIAVCQVAYIVGDDSQLLAVVSDAARDAIRNGELRLTSCAFQLVDNVQDTCRQLGRIIKYVDRGFRLPTGPLSAAPQALLDAPRSTNLRTRVSWLLNGRLHSISEPITPPRRATALRRSLYPLLLNFSRTDGGEWCVARPRSSMGSQQLTSAARGCAAPMAGLSRKLRKHAEALAVWTFVKEMQAVVYQTKLDRRSCVPQYTGWRVLGQLRRSGKGINRCDMYIMPPDVLPSLPLRALRPTNRAVRSFRGLHALLMERFASTASGGGGATTAARSSGRCPACCTLPCCRRASAGGTRASSSGHAAPSLPPKKRYRDRAAAQRDDRRAHAVAKDGTAAPQPAGGGPLELTGMWENVVRVNGVVRPDIQTRCAREDHLRQALQMAARPLNEQSVGVTARAE